MKPFLQACLKNFGVTLVVLLGLFLIAFNILNGPGFNRWLGKAIKNWENKREQTLSRSLLKAPPKPPDRQRKGEVQNYVLFTRVPYGTRVVVTGIRFGSTHTNRVAKQWCYLSDKHSHGGQVKNLELAKINKNGVLSITRFTPDSLKAFELTKKTVAKLILSHCRFVHPSSKNQPRKGKKHVQPRERNAVRRYTGPDLSRRPALDRCPYDRHRPRLRCAAFSGEILSPRL